MSIDETLKEAVDKGRLQRLELEFPSDAHKRTILLHPKLLSDINDADVKFVSRFERLRADLEMFVKGQIISMSVTPYGHKTAYMGLLDPMSDGIWEIRSRDPSPALRVFGKFPCKDVFVGLNWEPRSVGWGDKKALGDGMSLEFQFAMIEANKLWDQSLPGTKPITSGNIYDCVSEKVFLV